MLASVKPAPISSQQFKRLMAQLSGQQDRLATDLSYFKQQTGVMLQAAVHLYSLHRQACKQLLKQEPQLLSQLVALNTAAMQQLAAQLDKDMDVSRAAAVLANTLGVTMMIARVRDPTSQMPCPEDTANLTLLHDKGGYVVSLDSQQPQHAPLVAIAALGQDRPSCAAVAAHKHAVKEDKPVQMWHGGNTAIVEHVTACLLSISSTTPSHL
jgi:hypothetical protein